VKKQTLVLYYVALFVGAFIYWFFTLIPLNFRDPGFFMHFIFFVFLLLLPFLHFGIRQKFRENVRQAQRNRFTPNPPERQQMPQGCMPFLRQFGGSGGRIKHAFSTRKLLYIPLVLVVLYLVLSFTGSPIIQAKRYARLINKVEGTFEDDIAEIQFYDIPTVDRESAMRLGNKRMGEIADLVSQFDVASDYIQINYKGRPVRVTPLEYGDIFKWFNNRSNGLPRYISVDLISSEVDLDTIAGGMKYSESEPLFRNINRVIRFQYPFAIVGDPMFEVDDSGVPYWVTPVLSPRVGWFSGRDVKEVILTNAVDGKSERYPVEECPIWVDRAYPSDMIVTQLNDNGRYQSGWLNSLFGQKGVLQTTAGYNYLALNDDVYLYTGITSVASDSSNLGFVLVNQRTKETKFYPVSSADEYSAMASAQGAVQEKGYVSTFPILLNIEGRPTYCMALKDNAQLVKMYALVDAQNYQATAVGNSIREAIANYKVRLAAQLSSQDAEETVTAPLETLSGSVADIQSVVIEGNTLYYFMLEGEDLVFSASYGTYEKLPFLKAGDDVEVEYRSEPIGGVYMVESMTSGK